MMTSSETLHPVPPPVRAPSVRLGRVLVVDDDPAMRRVCARVLESEGWEVATFEHGGQAEAAVADPLHAFDCIVSDINMPEMDGFAVAAAVRRHDPDLPVLLMTGDPSLDGAVKAIDSGAVSYLSKPFSHETLAAAVARAARQHGVKRMRKRAESYQRELLEPGAGGTSIAARFQSALDQSWMAFQPIVDIRERSVFAYEALLRTDEQTLRRPDLLIAAAERLDRIHDLGRAVRAAVARDAAEAPPDALLFVNVHGLELTDEALFADDSPLSALSARVVLEITERIGIDEVAGPARVAMLRKLGYRIAVDDLGAGYAALGALAVLEPEIVKLDMSLVREIQRHPTKRRVVGAIATLCRELGSRVVAEGVETIEELTVIRDLGIDLIQGYLFARPARGFPIPIW
jgi:EAL domain-containing protein (putative c-di-GMP-specific phosphodiesterase class I)/CheY-like chemotaxis protein